MKNKIYYYSSLQDEVVDFKNKEIKIDKNYKYVKKNLIYKFFSWFTYLFLAIPFAFIFFKLIKRIKFHNSKILKKYKNGYFIYANHTNQFGDAFCPGLLSFPKKPHIIVNSANLSIPFLGKFLEMWGAVPIPNTLEASKNFYNHIENLTNKGNPIVIYPEAHLWPYYTKIREFSSTSFHYPIKFKKPAFSLTTVYKKRKFSNNPKIEIFLDGPFYANENIPPKAAQEQLKNIVYKTLKNRSTLSDYDFVKYVKRRNT